MNSGTMLPWEIPSIIPRQSGRRKLYLTSDEHYSHKKILQYQKRPFASLQEMNQELVLRHNSVVKENDVVIHVGDFSFGKAQHFYRTAMSLNGTHFFMDGSHDWSLRDFFAGKEDPALPSVIQPGWETKLFLLPKLFEFTFRGEKIVLCHYAMQKWWASHYGSYHFYGHSHGKESNRLPNSRDIGVDTTNFYPILIEDAINSVKTEKKEPTT
jgi:calcineurin-like phosphoesterase family protein